MTEAPGAVSLDRLPWLPDDPPVPGQAVAIWPWILAAVVVAAAAAFGLAIARPDQLSVPSVRSAAPSQTVALPRPRPLQQQAPATARIEAVEPIVAPPVAIEEPPPPPAAIHRSRTEHVSGAQVRSSSARAAPEAQTGSAAVPTDERPTLWPVRRVQGASGRLIRIGAFGSVHQAKRGWWAIVGVNPALERLPALVVPVRSHRDGKVYYRLQMGTTSQAHSAVLCQRMRMSGQSCAVIGLDGRNGEVAL